MGHCAYVVFREKLVKSSKLPDLAALSVCPVSLLYPKASRPIRLLLAFLICRTRDLPILLTGPYKVLDTSLGYSSADERHQPLTRLSPDRHEETLRGEMRGNGCIFRVFTSEAPLVWRCLRVNESTELGGYIRA